MSLDEISILSKDQFANVSLITNSTSGDENLKEIPRDYFICNDQKINKKSKEKEGQYFIALRAKILDESNEKLKYMMILKA